MLSPKTESGAQNDTPQKEPLDNPLYLFNSHCLWITGNLRNYLLGEVLTIIDGVIAEERQNKAVKDLIKNVFWKKEYHTEEFGEVISQYVETYQPEMLKYLKDIERTLGPKRTFFGKS